MKTNSFQQSPLISSDEVLCGYKEIAKVLKISVKTLRRHLSLIPITRLGRHVMILESDLKVWIRQNSQVLISKPKVNSERRKKNS